MFDIRILCIIQEDFPEDYEKFDDDEEIENFVLENSTFDESKDSSEKRKEIEERKKKIKDEREFEKLAAHMAHTQAVTLEIVLFNLSCFILFNLFYLF
jgi:hypothetical protein